VKDLRGRVAVVTGAASGIGLGVAEAFARREMRVMLADIDGDRLAGEVARLRSSGAEVDGFVADVSDAEQVRGLADATLDRFGAVHVICNNAGTIRPGRSWELPLEDWQLVLGVNLMGVIHGVRTFVPLLLSSGDEGHVVNVASMAAVVPVPGIGPYNVSKHGVLALSEVLHDELHSAGVPVGVSVVMPGRVRTRLGRPPGSLDDQRHSDHQPAPDDQPPGIQDSELMEPSEVGRQVVEAILAGRLFVFTHPERIAGVQARFARITGA
jgi:NAD(P)-dependent dehydrogenase (short-subunit alcohol dehydrogenase family)